MACSHVKFADGTVAIVKHSPARGPLCKFCRHRFRWDGRTHRATLLCDFEMAKTHGGGSITCDAPICVKCAKQVYGRDRHYCPKHARPTDLPPMVTSKEYEERQARAREALRITEELNTPRK